MLLCLWFKSQDSQAFQSVNRLLKIVLNSVEVLADLLVLIGNVFSTSCQSNLTFYDELGWTGSQWPKFG